MSLLLPDQLTRDEKHTYRLGRRVVPGVTQVIDAILAPEPHVAPDVWARKGELGTLIHEACAFDANDELDRESLDPEVAPYMQAWWRFKSETRAQILSSNVLVYHKLYDYAGEIDHEVSINEVVGVLDIKTGVEEPKHYVQITAYCEARGNRNNWLLYLRPNGDYRLVPDRVSIDNFSVFLAALRVYRWRQANGI